ncbi:MAG: DMT family transporter [Desulfocucumaceae bacterium]
MSKIKPVYLIMLLVPLIWSSNFIVGKFLIQHLPPFTITTARFGVSLAVLLIILKARGLLRLPGRDLFLPVALMGLSGVFAFSTILYVGLKYTTAVNSTIINAFSPISVAIVSSLWLGDKPAPRQFAGLLLSFLGVAVIAARGSAEILLSLEFNPGDVLMFLDTLVWAFFTVLGKKVMTRLSPLETTTWSNLAGVFFLVPAMVWEWGGSPPALSPGLSLALAYLGVFASVLAFLGWNKGVAEIGPARAAAFFNLIPVYAAVLAFLVLGESLHPYHLAGGIMVMAGVYLGIVEPKRVPAVVRGNVQAAGQGPRQIFPQD